MNLTGHVHSSLFIILSFTAVASAHIRITTNVTWEREIAPIVQARCVSCHAPGGRAPMPLTTYEEARPWAKAIKEEVLARRMPKWANARGYGDFINDPSLSPFEIALVTAWADGGGPRGQPSSNPVAIAQPTHHGPPQSRSVDVTCDARTLPVGLLLGVKPTVGSGESVRLTVVHPDGRAEPLLWVRKFDPKFVETYWLRNPVAITSRTRLTSEGPGDCSVTALLAVRKGK
jgi:hypothetical protein